MSIKLLLIESVTAGAFDRPLEHGLLEEAELMLAAMVAETAPGTAAAAGGVAPRSLRRASLPQRGSDIAVPVAPGRWRQVWRDALSNADAVWLLAPETAGELAQLSGEVEAAGVRLLGASSAAAAVAASKSACQAALSGCVRQPADVSDASGWVIKPDDGVAASGVRRLPEGPRSVPPGHLVQPFVTGTPLSLCVLSDGRDARVLSVNRQQIEWDVSGVAQYRGGITNAIPDRGRFAPMARAVQAAIPGLWGCWGIDLVLPPDGEPVLIEVNPRLTTAFAHLRAATGFDLLGALLALADGAALDAIPGVPVGQAIPFRLDGVLAVAT